MPKSPCPHTQQRTCLVRPVNSSTRHLSPLMPHVHTHTHTHTQRQGWKNCARSIASPHHLTSCTAHTTLSNHAQHRHPHNLSTSPRALPTRPHKHIPSTQPTHPYFVHPSLRIAHVSTTATRSDSVHIPIHSPHIHTRARAHTKPTYPHLRTRPHLCTAPMHSLHIYTCAHTAHTSTPARRALHAAARSPPPPPASPHALRVHQL